MAVSEQVLTEKYALYCGDCMSVLQSMRDRSVDLSVYSPPFRGLYKYTSDPRDFSNCLTYEQFMTHYGYLVAEMARVTKAGRITLVHCTDLPSGNTGNDHALDFPGDIIRLHEQHGFKYVGRYCVWKDPFKVYLRTLAKSLRHRTCVEDSARCSPAAADYLLILRRDGEREVPIAHPTGLLSYAGAREVPGDLLRFKGWTGKQTENKYSQWVWRQYASAFWDDVRIERVLPYQESREQDDEAHVHPLQLDVIDRAVVLWSNLGETIFTPFMGVGSEVYGAVSNGRRGIGTELKLSYYKQAVRNLEDASRGIVFDAPKQREMFAPTEWTDTESPADDAAE